MADQGDDKQPSKQKQHNPKGGKPPNVAPKPKLTKAERRALQEQQRAAKAARLGQPTTTGQKQEKQQKSSKELQHKKKEPPSASHYVKDASETTTVNSESDGTHKQTPPAHTTLLSHLTVYPSPDDVFDKGAVLTTKIQPYQNKLPVCAIELGYLYATKQITGSNARCRAMLDCFLTILKDTPPHTSLLDLDALFKVCFTFWTTVCRLHSTTMGNAFTFLKHAVTSLHRDPHAVSKLTRTLQDYQHERMVVSGQAITELLTQKVIKSSDETILTYGYSELVESVCVHYQRQDKRLNLIVLDSPPLYEGKRLLPYATHYANLSSLSSILQNYSIDKILLGAASMQSDGSILARSGTALICVLAQQLFYSVPVLFCAETYKISNRLHLDALSTVNEIVANRRSRDFLYDLTPPECATAIVTELGIVPPSSIAVLLREMNVQQLTKASSSSSS